GSPGGDAARSRRVRASRSRDAGRVSPGRAVRGRFEVRLGRAWWRRPSSPLYDRVSVVNKSDGGFWFWLVKFYGFGACVALAFLGIAGGWIYVTFAATLPPLPDFRRYGEESEKSTM